MTTGFDRVADSYIDADKEVRKLSPEPERRETPFSDYYREKEGPGGPISTFLAEQAGEEVEKLPGAGFPEGAQQVNESIAITPDLRIWERNDLFSIGRLNAETGEVNPSAWARTKQAVGWSLYAAFAPFKQTGMGIRGAFVGPQFTQEEMNVREGWSKKVKKLLQAFREGKITREQYNTASKKLREEYEASEPSPQELEQRGIEAYEARPWWEQMLWEAPAFGAAGKVGFTTLRQALGPTAARGGIPGTLAAGARVGLAPGAGVEWVMGKPLELLFGTAKLGVRKLTEMGLKRAFRKTPIYLNPDKVIGVGVKEFRGSALETDFFNAFKLYRQGQRAPAEQALRTTAGNIPRYKVKAEAPAKPTFEKPVIEAPKPTSEVTQSLTSEIKQISGDISELNGFLARARVPPEFDNKATVRSMVARREADLDIAERLLAAEKAGTGLNRILTDIGSDLAEIRQELGNRSLPYHGQAGPGPYQGIPTFKLDQREQVFNNFLQSVEGGMGGGAPPTAPPVTEAIIPPAEDPISKLTRLVKSAKPVRKETEVLKHEELKRRAGAAAGVLEAGEGREAFLRSKGMLTGKLPEAVFEPPEVGLTPNDITGLFNTIRDSADLPYFQKLNTSEALEKLLLGQIPTRGDIQLLEEVFGTDLAKAILGKRPMSQKAWDTFLEVWNMPRSLLASIDISAPLRQGAVLAPSHYKAWGKSFWQQLRALSKAENATAIDTAIRTGPRAELKAEVKLYHAPIGGVGAKLTQREEVWVSTLLQRFAGWWEKTGVPKKIITAPLYPIAKGVQISERAYITFLNKLRSDSFDEVADYWERIGLEATRKDYTELAKFINNATGRGSLGKLEESAPFLSGVLFSPRLQASRIRLAESLLTGTAPVRKEAAKDIVAFVATGLAILGIADLAGAEVETNPLSADFGKIRIGKTRLDIWGGFQQYARFITNLVTGMKKSSITANTYEQNRLDIIQQFVRSKLMPSVSLFYDLMAGRTYTGEKMELEAKQAYQRLAPMFVQDLVDAIESEGLLGIPLASPGAVGIGIITYDLPNWPELQAYYKLETTKERNDYRKNNPENEAKLFILGRFTTLKTQQAKDAVLRIMEEHKIKPKDIRGYENVFGEGAQVTGEPAVTWNSISMELGSNLLKALDRVWYKGGSLTPDETTKLQQIHAKYPLGQRDFNAWVKQTLRQFFENSQR